MKRMAVVPAPQQRGRCYRTRMTVHFGDVDCAGTVYYPHFLRYFHQAMEEFFRDALGLAYARFLGEHRMGLPTVHLEVDFHRPLLYGDEIEVEVEVERVGRSSVHWRDRLYKVGEDALVAESRRVTVNIDLDTLEKRQLPEWLREALEDYVAPA